MDDASPAFPNFMSPCGWKWWTYNAVTTDDSVIQPNPRNVDSLNRSNLSWMSCPNRGRDQSCCRMFPWKNPENFRSHWKHKTEVAHILANDYAAIPADLVIPLECWLQRWTGGKRSPQRGALVREFSKNDLLRSYKLKFVKYEYFMSFNSRNRIWGDSPMLHFFQALICYCISTHKVTFLSYINSQKSTFRPEDYPLVASLRFVVS